MMWPSGATYEGRWYEDKMEGGGIFNSQKAKSNFSPPSLEEALTILWKMIEEPDASAKKGRQRPRNTED